MSVISTTNIRGHLTILRGHLSLFPIDSFRNPRFKSVEGLLLWVEVGKLVNELPLLWSGS